MLKRGLRKLGLVKKRREVPIIHDRRESVLQKFLNEGKIPWSKGYEYYKEDTIIKSINDEDFLEGIREGKLPNNFGHRLDERVVEYPWIFSNIPDDQLMMIDAGSTFNFNYILEHSLLENKETTIFTYAPEANSFFEKRVSYVYGDLRDMYFKDETFDLVISQSTIEHIDMDNSLYGYSLEHIKDVEQKSYEYLKAVAEMLRILKVDGTLLLTFPYGKFENHGFFQQFDDEMLDKIEDLLNDKGTIETTYFRYLQDGWTFCDKNECENIMSFNPHTGRGASNDGAAHCRSVCCIKFVKTYNK